MKGLFIFVIGGLSLLAVADAQSCSSMGVTTDSQCSAQCTDSNCACSFVTMGSNYACTCTDTSASTVVFACSDGFNGNGDGDGDNSITPSQFRSFLILVLGEDCKNAVNNAFSNEAVNCFLNADETFAGFQNQTFNQNSLNSICSNACIGHALNAINTLVDADCLPGVADANVPPNFQPDDNSTAELFADLDEIEDAETIFNLACTESSENGKHCGLLFSTLELYLEAPSAFGANECTEVVEFGNCLGNIRVALEANPTLFDDDEPIPINDIIANLTTTCEDEGVSGVEEASQGTEEPADLASSAGSITSAVMAFVVTSVLGALLLV